MLFDNKGLKWTTHLGEFEITEESINWIIANAKPSMYNDKRSFIYNKAFYEAFLAKPTYKKENIFGLIRDWARERGIYDKGDPKTQLIKLYEESGELSQALLKNDKSGIIDAIGDSIVVLTNLAELVGTDVETCIQSAYDEISNRTGKMVNGTFVKTTL
jgi:NTP pyrophosphatase (non-canonical NTP hydrolase)